MGNARKAKEQSSAFRTFLCVGDAPGLSLGWVSYRAQGTGVRISACLGKQKPCAGTRPERIACVRDTGRKETRCATCSPQARLKSPGAELSFSGVSVRWGCAGAFARRVSSRPKGTGARPFPCPGKQKPGVGTRPERIACVRGMAKKKTGCASCSPQPRGGVRGTAKKKTRQTALRTSAAQKAASRVMSLPTQTALRRDGACALCPPQARDFCRPGKTEARRGPAPGNNRVRARRGEGTNTVRDLLGAAARLAHRRCAAAQVNRGERRIVK